MHRSNFYNRYQTFIHKGLRYCKISICMALNAITNGIPLYVLKYDENLNKANFKKLDYKRNNAQYVCKILSMYSENLYIPNENII